MGQLLEIMRSNAVFTIYQLVNPIDNKPFYIGMTSWALKTRLSGHISETKALKRLGGDFTPKHEMIYKCLLENQKPLIEQIDQVVGLDAIIRERQWIFYYLESGVNITNNAHEERIFKNISRNYDKTPYTLHHGK